MIVDELVEALMEATIGSWMACSLCGVSVDMRRVSEYTADVYPKLAKTQAHVKRNT